jgi:cysteine-rich repeat protein
MRSKLRTPQMKSRQKKILKFLLLLFLATGGFLFVQTVFAQEFGINEVGNEIGLPAEDPRVVAARIIRVALGFLGIVALAIILYGGFVWMTAGGNEERISKAKKILVNGVIGLVIIIMAFSITSFIINRLLEATRAPVGPPGVPVGPPGVGLPSDASLARSIQPVGSIPIRNVVVRVVFNRSVDAASLTGNFTVKKSSDQSLVEGTTNVSGSIAEFTPTASCPPPNETRKCFDADTEFTVEVTTAVRSADGRNLMCGGLARSCRGNFTTGDLVDVTSPEVTITDPDPGQSVSVDDLIPVQTHTTDNAGIAYLEYFADGSGAPWDPDNIDTPDTLTRDYYGSRDWDTTGLTLLSRHTLTSKAFDIDTNNSTSSGVEVIVRAAHCFDTEINNGETELNCGGDSTSPEYCGACSGGSCTSDFDCASGFCIEGICRDLPVITGVSPSNGASGNYITIFGRGFGATAGSVFFGDVRAASPAGCAAGVWQNNQIVVEVPVGAVDGPIRVEVPPPSGATPGDYVDRTNDERGPIAIIHPAGSVVPNGEFDVNDVRRPGLCPIPPPAEGEPGREVTVTGTQLGSPQGTSVINFGGTSSGAARSWSNTSATVFVPRVAPATLPVQAVVGGQNSNPVNFKVLPSALVPRILRFEPTSGPVGEYVTIYGSNFGDGTGSRVDFVDGEGTAHPADISFPPVCGTGFWKNDSVVVKVPTGATIPPPGPRYALKITTPLGSDDTIDLTPQKFEVITGEPKPGICLLDPDNGPVTTPVTIGGERFGTSAQVNFWRAAAVTVSPTDGGTNIATSVPSGAETGPVNVTVGATTSNNVNFTVRDCRTSTPQCENAAQECCFDGACRDECVRPSGQGFYFWRFSTGAIPVFPQVVEECTGIFPPPPQPTPSPSPWDVRGQTSICVNAKISARFTTEIDLTTLTSANIEVRKCIGAEPNPCATLADPGATPEVVPGRIAHLNSGPPDYQGSFDFIPTGGLWAQNYWYLVTLKDAITSRDGFALDGDKDGIEGGNYVFKFKTRNSPDLCRIGGVGVWPHQRIAEEEGEYIAYQGNLWAAGDACLLIDGINYDWTWRIDDPESRGRLFAEIEAGGSYTLDDSDPPNKVTVNPDGSPAGRDQTVATAREETVPGLDVQAVGRIPSEGVEGSGDLKIDFTDPKVVEKWPDCSDACVNAALGAKFNTEMIHTTSGGANYDKSVLNPANSKLYIWRCGNGVIEPGEDCDDGNIVSGDGCNERCLNQGTVACDGPTQQNCCGNGRREIGEDCDGVPFPARCSINCLNTGSDGVAAICGDGAIEAGEDCDDMPLPARCNSSTCLNEGTDSLTSVSIISRGYLSATRELNLEPAPISSRQYFLPNTFYRAVIFGSVASESRVNLTDLNFDDPNDSRTFSDTDFDSYSWTFKTKDDADPCAVDRVAVSPRKATLTYIDATRDYVSTPFSAPDLCSATGQRLGPMDYGWGWSSADTSVATVTNGNNRPACGNGILEFGEDCDDSNTAVGDGCDASCLNEGSRGTDASRCGNGIIEVGEDCDDGNTTFGDGCNNVCQNEGSMAGGSVCGDGVVGVGEDCDDGNTTSGDGCSNRCLNEGTVSDTFFDPYQTATAVGLKDADVTARRTSSTTEIRAEEMESGKAGTGDLTVTCNYGLQEDGVTFIPCPDLRCVGGYCQRSARERSSVTCRANLDCELSVGRDTCCHFKPQVTSCIPTRGSAQSCASGKTGVCRNAKVSATFNQLMDPTSATGNILVIGNYPKSEPCPTGTTPLADLGTWGKNFALEMREPSLVATFLQILRPIKSISPIRFINIFFGQEVLAQATPQRTNDWCVWPGTVSSIGVRSGTEVVTKVSFSPTKAFDPTKEYRALVLGDNLNTLDKVEGLKSLKGVALGNASVKSDLAGTRTIGGQEIYEWTFKTSADVCYLNRAEVSPNFKLFQRSGETEDFEVVGRDVRGEEIESLPGVYAWEWSWDKGGEDPTVINLSNLSTATQKRAAVPAAGAKNGDARILATAKTTADTIFTPRTVDRRVTGSADVIVFLCENPWPSDFKTSQGLKDLNYNFKTFHCRDRGLSGTADDLPIFGGGSEMPVINNPTARDPRQDDLLREYFLFNQGKYCTLSKLPCQTAGDCAMADESCQPSSDVIGIRIYENTEHLNLTDWYLAQGFRHGVPAAKTIDDYEAIQDGRTIYVAAANKSSSLYTNVYLISYNDGAGEDTMNIYDQLVKNWKFNINLENNKLCKDPGQDGMAGTSDDGGFVEKDDQKISCTSDLDCPVAGAPGRKTRQSLCDAPKDKITRDVKRLIDLKTIKSAINSYRFSKGYPPKLEAGTFVRGIAPSRWDSWDNVLAGELGAALPTDPLDQFMGCGDAKLCKKNLARICSTDADCSGGTGPCQEYKFDLGTCWSTDAQIYRCPAGSHIYQYIFNPRTGNYEIGTDFEYWEGPGIVPSHSWFTAAGKPIPPYVRYENTCSASAIYANTGICGDGTINTTTGEQCEIGDTEEATCETGTGAAGRKSRSCDIATCQWGPWSGCLSNCGNGILEPAEECDRGPGGGRIPGGGTSADNPYECDQNCRFVRTAWCGDGRIQRAFGEVCDDGHWNGNLSKACKDSAGQLTNSTTPVSCSRDADCGSGNTCQPYCDIDCVGSGPYCGDRIVTGPAEKCDNNEETAKGFCMDEINFPLSRVLSYFPVTNCTTNNDCEAGREAFARRVLEGADIRTGGGKWILSRVYCAPGSRQCIGEFRSELKSNPDLPCNSNFDCGENICTNLCPSGTCSVTITKECTTAADCPSGETCTPSYPQFRTRTCKNPGDTGVTLTNQCIWNTWGPCVASGECGNGVREGSEECDDGNTNNNDGCIITNRGGTFNKGTNKSQWNCVNAICGDGFTRTGVETCDSGDRNNVPCAAAYGSTCNFCTNECTLRTVTGPFCGDGIRNGAEVCDGVDLGPSSPEGWTTDSRCVDCRQMCPPDYLARQIYFAGGRPNIYLASGASTTVTLPACRLLQNIKADISLRGVTLSPINIVFEIGATARTADKLDSLKSALRTAIEQLAGTDEPSRFNIKIVQTNNWNGSGEVSDKSDFLNLDSQQATLDTYITNMGAASGGSNPNYGDIPFLPYKDELAGRNGDKFVIFIANRTQLMFNDPRAPDPTWSPKHRVFDIVASHNLPETIESAKGAGIKIYTILWSANTNQNTTIADAPGEEKSWERVKIPKRPEGCGVTEFESPCETETVTGTVPVDYDTNDFEIWSSKCNLKSSGTILGYNGADYSCRPAEGTPGFYKDCYTCRTQDATYYRRASNLSSVLSSVINNIKDVALALEIDVGGGESRLPVQTRDLEYADEFLIYDPSSIKGDQECATAPATGQTQQVPVRVNFSGRGTVYIANLRAYMCPGPPYPAPVYEADWCNLNPKLCMGLVPLGGVSPQF